MPVSLTNLSEAELDQLEKDIKVERTKRAHAGYEAFQQEVAALARQKGFPVPAFVSKRKDKGTAKVSTPSVPPVGAAVIENPANPSQKWWQGKRGAKPGWAK